ncbi:hypothetical protein BDY21DRAFT_351484 [Lineolata rhizophorae]|uniref:Uncharacterized protein n=1 Tax=Lineolata rhizophorae TaxID=578093 RepID=A0A6A6NUL7_9PEZI|nr:hypothetical protein BDY21DRAFT_351484 [Lineolata rhizophorae]
MLTFSDRTPHRLDMGVRLKTCPTTPLQLPMQPCSPSYTEKTRCHIEQKSGRGAARQRATRREPLPPLHGTPRCQPAIRASAIVTPASSGRAPCTPLPKTALPSLPSHKHARVRNGGRDPAHASLWYDILLPAARIRGRRMHVAAPSTPIAKQDN